MSAGRFVCDRFQQPPDHDPGPNDDASCGVCGGVDPVKTMVFMQVSGADDYVCRDCADDLDERAKP